MATNLSSPSRWSCLTGCLLLWMCIKKFSIGQHFAPPPGSTYKVCWGPRYLIIIRTIWWTHGNLASHKWQYLMTNIVSSYAKCMKILKITMIDNPAFTFTNTDTYHRLKLVIPIVNYRKLINSWLIHKHIHTGNSTGWKIFSCILVLIACWF